MSAFLASVLTDLPNLAAIGCNCSPLVAQPSGGSTGGVTSCGFMTPDGAGNLTLAGLGSLGASDVKRYLISVTKPALVTLEPSDWVPPQCDEIVAIVLGIETAFEDYTTGRLPYGSGKAVASKTLLVTCTGNGWLTLTSPTNSWAYSIQQWASRTTMGAFVCLRTGNDPGAKIVDLDEPDPKRATATFVGPKGP